MILTPNPSGPCALISGESNVIDRGPVSFVIVKFSQELRLELTVGFSTGYRAQSLMQSPLEVSCRSSANYAGPE